LFLELGKEIERVERGELVEVGVAELVEDSTVERGEEHLLVAVAPGWRSSQSIGQTGR